MDEAKDYISVLLNALHYFFKDFYVVLSGTVVSIVGLLVPIKDIVHLLIIFFIADVAFGYWAARVVREERFSVKIIWEHTVPRMFISIVLVTGAFMWDKVYGQDVIATYKIIGWFISGVLLLSIAQNGYLITKWSIFTKLGGVISGTIKDKTGFSIEDDKDTPL